MSRTVNSKKKVHSRAARRAKSPGIDLDKSLKMIKPPSYIKKSRPSILAIHQSSGAIKKSKAGRKAVLSAKAKRRIEKGFDRAAAVVERTGKKVERSRKKAKIIHQRSLNWEDVNKNMDILSMKSEAAIKLDTVTIKDQVNFDSLPQENEDIEISKDVNDGLEGIVAESILKLSIVPESERETVNQYEDEIL